MQRLLREKALSRYLTALERGDIDTIIAILQQSSEDALLERMIFEVHETYESGEQLFARMQEEDVMENESDTRNALSESELPELTSSPERRRGGSARWFQALAAVLLVGILGGGFLFIQYVRTPRSAPTFTAARHGWCPVPVIGLNLNIGAPRLYDSASASANDIWLVGSLAGQTPAEPAQTLVEHWDGAHLRVLPSQDSGQNGDRFMGVTEVALNNVWAVGSILWPPSSNMSIPAALLPGIHTLIEHWDGHQWSIIPSPDGTSATDGVNELQSVSAISANDIWAVGYTGHAASQGAVGPLKDGLRGTSSALVEHWNGHAWSIMPLPAFFHATFLDKIVAQANGELWISGSSINGHSFQPLLAHWNDRQWQLEPLPDNNDSLFTLNPSSPNSLWVAGIRDGQNQQAQVLVAHWNGSAWQMQLLPYPPLLSNPQSAQELSALAVTSFSDVWAVGGQPGPFSISVTAPVFIAHWDGRSWQKVSLARDYTGYLNIVTVAGGKVWAAGTTYSGLQQVPAQLVETMC
jgi:hypothetical protein